MAFFCIFDIKRPSVFVSPFACGIPMVSGHFGCLFVCANPMVSGHDRRAKKSVAFFFVFFYRFHTGIYRLRWNVPHFAKVRFVEVVLF